MPSRSEVLKMGEPVWSVPANGDPLRCQVIPGADSGLASASLFNVMTPPVVAEFCKSVFVGFDGYPEEPGGDDVENSLEARVELYTHWPPARRMIAETIAKTIKDAAAGEGDAVSD